MPQGRKTAIRKAIVAAARKMHAAGLSPCRSGNISVRWKDGMVITASGVHPGEMEPGADVVFADGARLRAPGEKAPSSEWQFHKAIYDARADIGAVVHSHSRYATALACAHLPIPAFHYMVAKAGGADIPLAPYATYGTPELARHAAAALAARNACLLANHGQVAIGATLDEALELAEEVEVLAAQYVTVRAIAQPVLLGADEMKRVIGKFETYGRAANAAKAVREETAVREEAGVRAKGELSAGATHGARRKNRRDPG